MDRKKILNSGSSKIKKMKCKAYIVHIPSQTIIILGEIQGRSSVIIRISYPSFLHGNDFLCFVVMNMNDSGIQCSRC